MHLGEDLSRLAFADKDFQAIEETDLTNQYRPRWLSPRLRATSHLSHVRIADLPVLMPTKGNLSPFDVEYPVVLQNFDHVAK